MFFFKISANLSLMARASSSIFCLTNSFPLSLCNFTHVFWDQLLLHVFPIHVWLPSTKQSSHTNQCRSLHKFFIYAIWILDLLCYIPPKLLLCGLRHEPPILDGDEDIVSILKSASAFEQFPYFMWFNWKVIQIKCNHVRYSGWHLITTSFPLFLF
jgi:hypothetical protein